MFCRTGPRWEGKARTKMFLDPLTVQINYNFETKHLIFWLKVVRKMDLKIVVEMVLK